jgi:hypothetical protein
MAGADHRCHLQRTEHGQRVGTRRLQESEGGDPGQSRDLWEVVIACVSAGMRGDGGGRWGICLKGAFEATHLLE